MYTTDAEVKRNKNLLNTIFREITVELKMRGTFSILKNYCNFANFITQINKKTIFFYLS